MGPEQRDLIAQWKRIGAAKWETMRVPVREPMRDGNASDNET